MLIGLAVSSVSITAIMFRPFAGVISDRWSRSYLMILGIVCASFAYLILFISSDIAMITVARLVEGLASALFIPSSIASAIDHAPEGKLGQTLGWRSLMVGVGLMIGPAMGGFLSEIFSYKITFIISAVLLLLLIPLVKYKEPQARRTSGGTSLGSLRDRDFLIALSGLIIYALSWTGLLAFLSAYLKLGGYGDLEIGLFVSIEALASLALRVIAGRRADSDPAKMTYSGLLIISFAFLLVYATQVPPYLYLAAAVMGVGIGIYIPSSQTLALTRCPAGSRGLVSATYVMGMDVGNLIGPTTFGMIIESTDSYQSVFALAPVLTLVAGLAILALTRKRPTRVECEPSTKDMRVRE